MPTAKQEALRLIGGLPEDATWEDVAYRLRVREAVERGLTASDADDVLTTEQVRARLAGAPRPETAA